MPPNAAPDPVVSPFGRLWPEPWASQVAVQAAAVQGELDRALGSIPEPSSVQIVARWHIERMLDEARAATQRGRLRWRGPLDRWRGTSVERSHYCLHVAKTALVDILGRHELDALIPTAVARVSVCLPANDPRRQQAESLATDDNTRGLEEKRAQLKRALEIGYDASDQLHTRLRAFRNLLIGVGAVIMVFMVVLVGVVWNSPSSVPLCFTPVVDASLSADLPATRAGERTVCPSGDDPVRGPYEQAASPPDIAIVAGLGTVGGALAAAFAIRNLRGTSTPYDVPLALAFLKVPIAALTAVAGILLLGGGFVPGLSELDSQRQIVAYALLLGYAQQLFTQLIDKQAQGVLDRVPSKEDQPTGHNSGA